MRRSSKREAKEQENSSIRMFGDMKVYSDSRRVFIDEKSKFDHKEFDLLELLMNNQIKFTAEKNCSMTSGDTNISEMSER